MVVVLSVVSVLCVGAAVVVSVCGVSLWGVCLALLGVRCRCVGCCFGGGVAAVPVCVLVFGEVQRGVVLVFATFRCVRGYNVVLYLFGSVSDTVLESMRTAESFSSLGGCVCERSSLF